MKTGAPDMASTAMSNCWCRAASDMVAGRQVRLPDEPDEQVGDQRQDDPDQEEPQAVARTRDGLRRLSWLGPGLRGLGLGRHELTTSISPIM